MHVETNGTGRDVVLLHGNAPPASLAPLAEELSDRFRTHLVSLPGFRPSTDPYPDTMEEVRDLLVAFIEDRDDSVVLLGHSFGAYRAFFVALEAPNAVDAIVALSPLAGLDEEERAMFRQFADGLRAGADLSDAAAAQWVSPGYLDRHPHFRDQIATWLDRDRLALASDIEASADVPNLQGRLGEIRCPVYVRTGELDAPIPPERAEAIASRIPNATGEVAPGVGHMLAFEDLESTSAAIRTFLG